MVFMCHGLLNQENFLRLFDPRFCPWYIINQPRDLWEYPRITGDVTLSEQNKWFAYLEMWRQLLFQNNFYYVANNLTFGFGIFSKGLEGKNTMKYFGENVPGLMEFVSDQVFEELKAMRYPSLFEEGDNKTILYGPLALANDSANSMLFFSTLGADGAVK